MTLSLTTLRDRLSRSETTEPYDYTRPTTPTPTDKVGGLYKTRTAPNGHVSIRLTKHEDHIFLPTQQVRKCFKCGLRMTGTPYGSGDVRGAFRERCRAQTCLEYAYREFRTGNRVRGAERIEQVCATEGLIEHHQFAEGIGVPTPSDA